MLATMMQALDTTIANVALPHMQGSLSATQDQITWVLTSYIVAAAIMTPLTGWLAGRFGRKRVFLISIAGFTVASVLCGIATQPGADGDLPPAAGRVRRGAGAAVAGGAARHQPAARSTAQAMAIWGMGVILGPILGPALGGWLTDNYNWRWVFFINLPIGVLALLGILVFIRETAPRAAASRSTSSASRAQPRDRRAADDARPRRAQGLVRLDRDLDRGDDRRARLLSVRRPHRDRRATARSSTASCCRTATSSPARS